MQRMRSSARASKQSHASDTLVSMLRWVSGTVLGRLSEPLVNRTAAIGEMDASVSLRHDNLPRTHAASLARRVNREAISSRQTNRSTTSPRSTPCDCNWVTTARAVSTTSTPTASRPCLTFFRPAVQFTITGVLPANIAARYRIDAPTDAGIIIPTCSPGSSAMLPCNASMPVTTSR